ncbi:MAG: cbb3-type cytochrome c oxidase N-terminal domain-containing protein, partial [Bacteroidota bacterium]|nr:cbb3-type cytochrome c oxidase N-terminal domain-containing protein [Bacteroidota bacterium]
MEPNQASQFEQDELTGDKILSGHDYDGIKELDNDLPKWWVWLFYITIIFAVIYMLNFHVLGWGNSQADEYNAEMAAANVIYQKPVGDNILDASSVTVLTDEASLQAGKEIWVKSCTVCHLAEGQGLVGPNMTDEYWIHGCSIGDIFNIILVGV